MRIKKWAERGRPQICLRPGSAYDQDFAHASANRRPEFKFDKSVSQSAARIQMMNHH